MFCLLTLFPNSASISVVLRVLDQIITYSQGQDYILGSSVFFSF
uniref:Uncharacterized protein n=1 Tax=Lepeophtheirus salmonis TaxID=72036 RepID=A0A0K2TPE7_LEPSM